MMLLTTQAFPPRSGGIETLMSALARYAAGEGEKVHVFADGGGEAAKFDRHTSPAYKVTRFGGLKPLRRRRKAKAVGRAVETEPQSFETPPYIFADSWKSLEHLPDRLSLPVITYAHGNEYPRIGNNDHHPKQARIKKALSKATHFIAVSRDTQNRAAPYMPHGLESSILHPPVEPVHDFGADEAAYAHSLWPDRSPGGSIRLLSLCRLIEWKGIDQAIKALGQLQEQGLKAQLVIAGTGDDRPRLDALTAELGLGSQIAFAGRVEGGRKSALLKSADIFVQPGRTVGGQCEGFGISYIEAALHGLPSVCGNAGGAVDAVIDTKTGFIIDAETPDNVTAALKKLVGDSALRARMSQAARQHGEAALWPKQIKRILALKER
jgi:phosphatidylinositol alpha-1,6-mannosyltransferase